MINSKEDYLRFLASDQRALRRTGKYTWRSRSDLVWTYQRLLREKEYILNCHRSDRRLYWRCRRRLNDWRFSRLGALLSFTIPPNCFDEGLCIAHHGTIVVNHKARIGKNCEINVDVNIGMDFRGRAPTIGDDCFISPGAKIFGGVTIVNNVIVGANAVVNRSFPEGNCSLVGVPVRAVPMKWDKTGGDRYREA